MCIFNLDEDDYGFTKSPEYGTRVANHSTASPNQQKSYQQNPPHKSILTNGNVHSSSHIKSHHHIVNGGGKGMYSPNGGGSDQHASSGQDKWYLQDTMQPIDAPQHGGNCKCYRCQRKLTAI